MATTGSILDPGDNRDRRARAGTLLAKRYRVDGATRCGRGCFEATDRTTGARVLLKLGQGRALPREAELLAALDHPSIVRLKDSGRDGDVPFIVLEWIDGSDLEALLARSDGAIADDRLIQLLCGLADAVAAIHAAGWLHRDLKPANVMLRPDGGPVLVDFGAALPIGESATAETEVTDGYGAPEQYLSDAPEGPWTDIYGLGAIAYRALCGRAPLPAPARLRGEAMPLAMDHAGTRDEALCRAVDWALALERRQRPQTVEDWRAALSVSAEHAVSAAASPSSAAAGSALDDYPPTVRVRRAPLAKVARPAAAAPVGLAAQSSRRRAGAVLAAVLLLAGGAGVAGAAWYGRPLYERYVKTDWVVDPGGGGDARSIADAIARARDGATIAIRPGTYHEGLTIERPLDLVPAVPEAAPLIAPSEGPCVVASGAGGSISGLRFAGAKAADPETAAEPCLLLSNSSVRVAGNRITGGAGPAILVRDGGAPAIAGNAIENGAGPGIVVAAGAAPQIVDNTITKMAQSALIIRGGAAPAIRDNTIEASGGLVFAEGAAGTLEGNQISASTASGIEITSGADPAVIDNTIEQSAGAGIFVYDHGRGRFERNFVIGSRLSGVVIAAGGDARLSGNAIRESAEHGVLVVEGGRAVIEGNAVADNRGNGIVIGWEAEVEQNGNELTGNVEPQLLDARTP
ncbi:MAG TPA: right-handed parallel beta-helix repeat-containing protein [Geminicoccaceae bacterium]